MPSNLAGIKNESKFKINIICKKNKILIIFNCTIRPEDQ